MPPGFTRSSATRWVKQAWGCGGSEAEVFLPALYPLTYRADDDQLRLGRDSDWIGHAGEPVRGVGLRVFLVGDQDRTILAMDGLRFNTPV